MSVHRANIYNNTTTYAIPHNWNYMLGYPYYTEEIGLKLCFYLID